MSLKLRLFGGIGICVLLLFMVFSTCATWQTIQIVEQQEQETFQMIGDTIQIEMTAQLDKALLSASVFSNNEQIQRLFAEGNREELLQVLLPAYLETKDEITHLQFHLPDSTSFLRVHAPEEYGDSLAHFRNTVNDANRSLTMVSGLEEGRAGFGFRAVNPMFYQGEHIGSVETGTDFGVVFLEHLQLHFGGEYYIYRCPDSPSVAWQEFRGREELLASVANQEDRWTLSKEDVLKVADNTPVFTNSRDQKFALILIPFADYLGDVKGYFKIVMDRQNVLASISSMRTSMYTYSILAALIMAVIVYIYLGHSLRPLQSLAAIMKRISAGDLQTDVEARTNDEIGKLAQSFQTMVIRLREIVSALEKAKEKQTEHLRDTVLVLAAAVEARDAYTINHSQQVASIAGAIGSQMGMEQAEIEQLYFAGLLHDIGKIGVPDFILQKPGSLSDLEFTEIKTHPNIGYRILEAAGDTYASIAPLVRHHHEKWNGEGYPDGLKGEEIPLGAAILGVADAFDAMVSNRPYRNALTEAEALAEIKANRGEHFHPEVVDVFLNNYPEIMKGAGTATFCILPQVEDSKPVIKPPVHTSTVMSPFDYRVRYDGILQALNQAVLVFSEEMLVIDWNHKAEELYGYDCFELKDMPAEKLFYGEEGEGIVIQLKKAENEAAAGVLRTHHCKKDGKIIPVEIRVFPLVETGKQCWLNLIREL